jgi:serine/threonine-protein kinase HipA
MCQALGYSPNLKYQSDGGPGIKEIMNLLLGSKNAIEDRDQFFRSQIVFWLIAAIDGHAKNFSIIIEPGGKYHLAPLYDILSAYPLMAMRQVEKNKVKMAMFLKGKNNHYHWNSLQRRYFLETADYVNYSAERAEKILNEVLSQVNFVINAVKEILPTNFPKHVSQPIFEGMLNASQMLV